MLRSQGHTEIPHSQQHCLRDPRESVLTKMRHRVSNTLGTFTHLQWYECARAVRPTQTIGDDSTLAGALVLRFGKTGNAVPIVSRADVRVNLP